MPPKSITSRILTLVIVTTAVWCFGTPGAFVWIDHVEIEQAGYRATSRDDFLNLWQMSLDQYLERDQGELNSAGGYFRPVYGMNLTAAWWYAGNQPFLYHLENIAWHLIVVVGLYLLGRRMLEGVPNAEPVVFLATLLFAVHPFGVHSVTWISGRKDTMCAGFAIFSLLLFARLLDRSDSTDGKRSNALLMLAVWITFGVAVLCKELAFVLPAVVTGWMWIRSRQHRPNKSILMTLAGYWLVAMGFLIHRHWALGGMGLNVEYPAETFTGNFLVSARLLSYYLYRIVIPWGPTIVDRWPVESEFNPLNLVCAAGFLILWTGAGVLILRRNRGVTGMLWFLVWMLPASGLVPLRHMYAERYLYPASWGVLLTLVWAMSYALNRVAQKPDRMFAAAGVVMIVVFSGMSIQAMRFWENDQTLFEHAVRQNPHYAEGLSALALIHLDREEFEDSARYSQRAIEAGEGSQYRSYWSPFVTFTNAGLANYRLDRLDAAQKSFEKARDSRPGNAISYYHLGLVAGAKNDQASARAYYQRALELDPRDHLSRNNLGHFLLQAGQYDQSVAVLTPVIDDHPDDLVVRGNLGTALLMSGQYEQAVEQFSFIVDRMPNDEANLAKLAWSQWESGDRKSARSNVRRAQSISPNHPTVLFVLDLTGQN